jgi:hypothetical protein
MVLLDVLMWITLWITLGKMWITFLWYENRLRYIEHLYIICCQVKTLDSFLLRNTTTIMPCYHILYMLYLVYIHSKARHIYYILWGVFYICQVSALQKTWRMYSFHVSPPKNQLWITQCFDKPQQNQGFCEK